jgi:hypothetical protein
MQADVVTSELPIAKGPKWGVPSGHGLGVEVDEAALADAVARYARDGQFLPYDRSRPRAGD